MQELKQLWSLLDRATRLRLGVLLALMVVCGFLELVGLGALIPFMAVASNEAPYGSLRKLTDLVQSACGYFGFGADAMPAALGLLLLLGLIFSNLLICFYQIYMLWLTSRLCSDLNIKLIRRLSGVSLDWLSDQNTSKLSHAVLAEVSGAVTGAVLPTLQFLAVVVRIVIICLFFLYLQPRVALGVSISIGVAFVLISLLSRNILTVAGQKRTEAVAKLYLTAFELFGGFRDIRVTNSQPYFLKRFYDASHSTVAPSVVRGVPGFLTRSVLEVATAAVIVVMILIFRSKDGNLANGLPLLSAYALAGMRILPAVQQAIYSSMEVRFHLPCVARVTQMMRDTPPEQTLVLAEKPLPFRDKIEFQEVSYSYPNSPPLIGDLNLTIRRKGRVALVGPTGAGKSTLVDLLLGLRWPTRGHLKVDGVTIDESSSPGWQLNIGFVPQDIFLRDTSVAENVAFGVPAENIDQGRLEEACRMANIYDFIVNELPEKFNTRIGERGVRLSGGQCQRLGIARALYKDPEVIVFDEATSSLDNATENSILSALDALRGRKTLIVVAHRLNTIWDFEQIVVLQGGRIQGVGTADELRVSCPTFQELVKFQKEVNPSVSTNEGLEQVGAALGGV